MFHSIISPPRKVWTAALASLACLCGPAGAQNFTMQVTNSNPLGLGNFIPSQRDMDLGLTGAFKGAVAYGVGVYSEYNSNFFLTETGEEGELSMNITPRIKYVSDPEGGAMVTFNANYQPILRGYLENSDLNGMDQAGDLSLKYQGGRTTIDLFGNYQGMSGTDRLTGNFVEGSVMTGGVRASRQVAPRTTLHGGWSVAISDYGDSMNEGSNVYTTYFGGLWNATERIGIGATIRNTLSESDNTGTNDAWALLMEARYNIGERFWLSASVGPQYSSNSGKGVDDGGSLGLTGDVSLRYMIDERWSWSGSIRSATVPSPSETNYLVNDVGASTELRRQLLRGWIAGGLNLSLSEYESVGAVAEARGNEQNLGAFIGYGRSFFNDRVEFGSTLRYTFNEGETDWSQFIFTLGGDVRF